MTNARIVDGEDAGFNTWSWAVSLKIRKNTASYRCGGTIIDESYVMTAAHCLDLGLNPSDITVYAGALHVYDGVIRTASQIYIHPSYDKTQSRNDIALIKLDQPLDLSNVNLAKICLPTIATTSEEYPAPSTSVVTVGWGTLWSDGPVSQILQQVTIQAVAAQSTYCQHIIKDPTVQFCAGTMPAGGKDTCQGDSGGPLMMFNPNKKWELVGVVSYGKGCGLPNYPGVYTRVSSYIEWINKTIPYRPPTTTYKPRTTEPTTTHKPRTTESATTRPPWPTTRTKETSTFPPRPTTTTGKMTTDGVGNSSGSININAYFLFSILIFVFNY